MVGYCFKISLSWNINFFRFFAICIFEIYCLLTRIRVEYFYNGRPRRFIFSIKYNRYR